MRISFLFMLLGLHPVAKAQERPKLVVGIVIDQMRPDYLYRFSEQYGEGGFMRLMREGHQFKNAHYNYMPTYTAPGHASIYTGTTPSYHGIIANNWYDKNKDRSVYCVADVEVSSVGGSKKNGKMSPRKLQASTLTDELLLSTNFQSKVVGVSIKDRGAILPAGHRPTGAYWFDSPTGNFMTSDYYADTLATWAQDFNNQKKVSQYLKQEWNTLYPLSTYKASTQDSVPYERAFKGQKAAVFPYDLEALSQENGLGLIRTTPYGNTLVLDMALAAIEGEALGSDEVTDFLAVSFSSTDYVGHAFGPNSIELQDTYLRLDKEIERLLRFLDEKLGKEYLLFLTADHGAVEVPLFLQDMNMVGGYIDEKELINEINNQLTARFGEGEWIKDFSNDQFFLDHEWIQAKGYTIQALRDALKEIVISQVGVANVYTAEDLLTRNSYDPIKRRFENGFNQKMSGDVTLSLVPGYLLDAGYGPKGTTHGSPYTYDTHVPLLFFGKGIAKGVSVDEVAITDIAPTLSMLLSISLPSACTGQPLKALFK